MLEEDVQRERRKTILAILTIGALWGIFEATVGYVLHLLPISIGWLVWYPVACFFMAMTYFQTKKAYAVICVGVLSAGIKLLNLALPVSIDRVINPSVSIVFEALTMFCAVCVLQRTEGRSKPYIKAATVLLMNTGWRLLYILYILVIVPQWMRDISVISSAEQITRLLLTDNLATSGIIFIGFLAAKPVRRWLIRAGEIVKNAVRLPTFSGMADMGIKIALVTLLLCADAALQLLL